MMKYFLLLLISYLGLAIGTIISHMAKEELKTGKKFFRLGKSLVFTITIYFFLQMHIHMLLAILIALISFVIAIIWTKKIKNELIFYAFYSLILFETVTTSYASLITLLIFCYGLFVSSIKYNLKSSLINNIRLPLQQNIIYPIMGVLLIILFRT